MRGLSFNKNGYNSKFRFWDAVWQLVAILVSLLMLIPFLWLFLSSFKSATEIIQIPLTFFPRRFTLATYQELLDKLDFGRYFLNSVIVSTATTLLILFTSSLAGFVFAKYRFRWKEVYFLLILSSMMIPFAVIVIPLYMLMSDLGWIDTYAGLIVPMCVSAFGIFLMRQFMEGIPDALLEAARIDGASDWWIYYRVILPLSKSAASALGIFSFMWSWNNLFWPLMVTMSPEMRTLTLGVATLQWEYGIRYDAVITGAAIATIPVIIVYAFARRNFIQGLTLTGLKY
ncbi:MAG: carbohydrate ABC transporter permease [Firmicutes bacterium]|nr:carbohydrate ABC transporter permease [Bacillota bacterium]